MLFRIEHETVLSYDSPVFEHVFELRMAPVSDDDQTSLGYRLRISPLTPSTPYRDGHGNRVELITVLAPCQKIVVRATSFVRTHRRPSSDRLVGVRVGDAGSDQPGVVDALDYIGFTTLVDSGPWLDSLVKEMGSVHELSLERYLYKVTALIKSHVKYEKKRTEAGTPASAALALGAGVCQDFSHLFLAICRRMGVPARYVSGYIHQPGEIESHAWVQVWAGATQGWIDFDPTHNCLVADDHVVVAVGRDYSDVPPNRGAWRGEATESIHVAVRVESVPRLPADWIDADSLPLAVAVRDSGGGGGSAARNAPRPSARQFHRMLYRQQQHQQQH